MELEIRNKLFEEFYKKSGQKLKWFCYKYVGGHSEIDDMMQLAFLKIYENIHKYDETKRTKLETWAFTIARNKCIDYLRKRKRQIIPINFGDLSSGKMKRIENKLSERIQSEEKHKQRIDILTNALNSLKESEFRIIELHYFEKFKLKEVGKQIGVSPENVRSMISRIRRKIKRNMKGY